MKNDKVAEKNLAKRKIFGILCTAMMVSMGFVAFANTGCTYPWENMDNMIVTAGITRGENDTFGVTGGVTSASVKALGYVSGAEEAAAALSAASDMTSGSKMRPSVYDMLRWDGSARREVDYARVSGLYNNYYGKESWYSVRGDAGAESVRQFDRTAYSAAVASASGLSMSSAYAMSGAVSPFGQVVPDMSFNSADMLSFNFDGIPTFGGKIKNISGDFLFQTFSWDMTGIEGSKYGEKNAVIYVKPIGTSVDVRYSVNGTSLAGDVFDYADVYMQPQADGAVFYKLVVVTDAMRFLENVGDELTVDVSIMMNKYIVNDWTAVSNAMTSDDATKGVGDSLTSYLETAPAAAGVWLKNQFDDMTEPAITSLTNGLDSVFGGWQVGPLENMLTGGIVNTVAASNNAAIQKARIDYLNYQLESVITYMNDINATFAASVGGNFTKLYNDLKSGTAYSFGYKVDYWSGGNSLVGARDRYEDIKIDLTWSQLYYDVAYEDLRERGDGKWGVDTMITDKWHTSEKMNTRSSDALWNGNGQECTDGMNSWLAKCIKDITTRFDNSVDDIIKATPFPKLELSTFITDGGTKAFAGQLTRVKAASFADGSIKYIMDTFDGKLPEFQSQFEDAWANFGANTTAFFNDNLGLNITAYTDLGTLWSGFDNISVSSLVNMSKTFKEERDALAGNMSSVLSMLDNIGFNLGFDTGSGVWTFDADWDELKSNFDVIEGVYMPTPNYIFSEDLFNGKYSIPVQLDVSNDDMLDNTTIEVYSVDSDGVPTILNTINCTKDSGGYFRIPIELDIGNWNLRAKSTFTNGTPTATDDVVMETVNLDGFGSVRVLDMSIDSLIKKTTNPFFSANADPQTYNVRFVMFDVDDNMEVPFTAFIGGSSKSVSMQAPGQATVKWTLNYIREHSYTGKIIITDNAGKVVHEEVIPEFSFKAAAFSASSRSSDTLALSEMAVDSEYTKIGDW